MALEKKKSPPRMSRAWIEGYVEGRINPAGYITNPHDTKREANEFCHGFQRGRLNRSFLEGRAPEPLQHHLMPKGADDGEA